MLLLVKKRITRHTVRYILQIDHLRLLKELRHVLSNNPHSVL